MKILNIKHKYNWITKVTYRESVNDIIIRQTNGEIDREVYLDTKSLSKILKFWACCATCCHK